MSFVSAGSDAHMQTPAQAGAGAGGIKGKRPNKKDKLRVAAKEVRKE